MKIITCIMTGKRKKIRIKSNGTPITPITPRKGLNKNNKKAFHYDDLV